MIQFNLLPDVKLQFIRAQRLKRLVITVSFIVTSVCLVIFILLFLFVRVSQKNQIDDLTADINDGVSKIEKIPDLDKILTVQNQLKSLPGLHNSKVISSRLFGYLDQLQPAGASRTNVEADFEAKTLSIKGTADSIDTVRHFVDTLKYTFYSKDGSDKNAFTNVVLGSYALSGGQGQTIQKRTVDYEIRLNFEGDIFMNTGSPEAPKLTVERPSDLANIQNLQEQSNQ